MGGAALRARGRCRPVHLALTLTTAPEGGSGRASQGGSAAAPEAGGGGGGASFDPNLRPTLWPSQAAMVEQINRLAAKADWVLPGLGEGKILTGHDLPHDVAGFYLQQGARLVVIKLGAEGAYYRTAEGDSGMVPGERVAHVVDTVGAGDGFAAGLVSALLEGLPLAQAVRRGNRVGAFAIQVIGDMDGLPTRAELGLPLAA